MSSHFEPTFGAGVMVRAFCAVIFVLGVGFSSAAKAQAPGGSPGPLLVVPPDLQTRRVDRPPPAASPGQITIGAGVLDRNLAYPRVSEGRLAELETLLRGGVGDAAYEVAAVGGREARNVLYRNAAQTPRFALAAFPSQEAVDLLLEGPLSRATADALTRIGPLAVDTLRRMVRNEENAGFAVPVLAAIGDSRALPELVLATRSSDPSVVRNAITALGDLGDPRGANALRSLTGDARNGQAAWTNLARIARPADLDALIAGHQGGVAGLLGGIYRLDPERATTLLRQQLELGSGPGFGQALSLTLALPVTDALLPLLHGIVINGNGRGVALARLAMADNLGALRVILRLIESPPEPVVAAETEEAQLRLMGMLHLALAVSLRITHAEGELRERGLERLSGHEEAPLFLAIARAREAVEALAARLESEALPERVRALLAISVLCEPGQDNSFVDQFNLNGVLVAATKSPLRIAAAQAIGRCGVLPSEPAIETLTSSALRAYLPNTPAVRESMRWSLASAPAEVTAFLARVRDRSAFSFVVQRYATASAAERLALAPYMTELAEANGPEGLEALAALRRRAMSLAEYRALFTHAVDTAVPNLVFRERALCRTPTSLALTIENAGVFALDQGALACNAFPVERNEFDEGEGEDGSAS